MRACGDRSPLSLIHLSTKVHCQAESEISTLQRSAPSPSCTKGCHHCCHGLIPVTIPELLELAQEVESWEPAAQVALSIRCDSYAKKSLAYWRYDLHQFSEPCPLLVEGECSVYEKRPLFCRGRSSYDPAECEAQKEGRPVPVHAVPGQQEVGANLVNGIFHGMKRAGRYSGTYDLGGALAIVLGDPTTSSQVAEGVVNPLNRVMMGSDANVSVRHLNEAARKFLVPEFVSAFQSGISWEERYRRTIRISKASPYGVLCELFLPAAYESQDELEEWWNRYQQALSMLPELQVDPAVAFESAELGAANTFGLAYTGKDVLPSMELLGGYFHRIAQAAHPQLTAPIKRARRPGPFRLGFLSRRLKHNNGSRWALGWATELGSDIETYAFNLHETDDHVSTRWRRSVDHYYHLPNPAPEVAVTIRELDLDALIFTDVGSDGLSLQLSVLRMARRQYAAWGFPMTTGSPEMDGYLSSEEMEPDNGQDHYTEKLIRLPGSGQSFPKARSNSPSTKSARELGLPEKGFLLIAQNPAKLLPKRDEIFKEISERHGLPIVICDSSDGILGNLVMNRMLKAGIRVQKLGFLADSDFFRVIQLATVVLDSFDFTGGITTIDAITLGKPPVTCPGEFMRGRLGVPFMRQAGVADLIAFDDRAYIEMACHLERIQEIASKCVPENIYRDRGPVEALKSMFLNSL